MTDFSVAVWGLFVSAFVSSTIAPGGSEVLLAYWVAETSDKVELLIVVATVGNTLGALTTWWLGSLAAGKFPVQRFLSNKKQNSVALVKKWGGWALLFSWLPVIGDGLCFAGGWLKLPFYISLLAIIVGKASRYALIAYVLV